MLVSRPIAPGFTLIELMVAIAIAAFLLLLASPSISDFLVNSRIRGTADSIANGIRQARMEAVKRNQPMQFVLGAGIWTIQDPAGPTVVHTEPLIEATGVTATAAPAGATTITYSSLGQYMNPNPDATAPIQLLDFTSSSTANPHALRVVADPSLGVGLRMCDPRFALPDPMGCP